MAHKLIKIVSVLSLVAMLAVPALALAQINDIRTPPRGVPGLLVGCTNVQCIVFYIVQIVLAIVFLVALILLVIGGFRYITSQGNEEGIEKAKGTITNAIIGLVIVLLAWIIVRALVALLNAGTSGT